MDRRNFNRLLLGAALPPVLWDNLAAAISAGAAPSNDIVELLRWMVRVDTQNPPADGKSWRESGLNQALAAVLHEAGVPARVIESTPGRGSLVARLTASGSGKPLLLATHIDVVGAQGQTWQRPPFAADSDGQFIYGRGTLDNKSMAAALFALFLRLAREKAALARDIILCLVCDEESGGSQGMRFLVENHWDEIASEVALGEGDPPLTKDGRIASIPIQCGEKKSYAVRLRAQGTSGHASTPLEDNPILTLARAVERLQPYSTAVHVTPLAREYLRRMAQFEPPSLAAAMRDIADHGEQAGTQTLDQVARANPVYNAVLRATICPTLLQAGSRANVIPAEAEATLSIRVLPDQNIENIVAELRDVIASDRVAIEMAPRGGADGPATPHDTAFFKALERASSELWPGIVSLPYLAPAASDARYLRARGVMVYGYSRFPPPTMNS